MTLSEMKEYTIRNPAESRKSPTATTMWMVSSARRLDRASGSRARFACWAPFACYYVYLSNQWNLLNIVLLAMNAMAAADRRAREQTSGT
jgi:hypothetical protein